MSSKRVAGMAAVCFAVFAGLESTFQTSRSPNWASLLLGPTPGSPSGELADYYAIGATTAGSAALLGVLSLASYVVFVASLRQMLTLDRRSRVIGSLLLGSGVAGPAVAAAAVARRWAASSTSTDALTGHHAAYQDLRLLGGLLMGVTLLTVAAAASPTRTTSSAPALPPWLTRTAAVTGGLLLVTCPFAMITPTAGSVAHVGLVAGAAWVASAGTWLLMPAPEPALAARQRAAATTTWLIFFVVAVAAGASGVALLAAPQATGAYFSWPLGPAPFAALVGVNYLLAAAAYGLALRDGGPQHRPTEARGLLLAVLGLSVPVFVTTVIHASQFDFRRWQATVWIVLFGVIPLAALASLWLWRGHVDVTSRIQRHGGPVVVFWYGFAGAIAVIAALMLFRPLLAGNLPGSPGPLAIRVLAGWLLFAATLAAWTAARPAAQSRPARAVLPLFAVVWLIVPLTPLLT